MADEITYDPIFAALVERAAEHITSTNSPEKDSGHALNFGIELANTLAHKLNPEDRRQLGEKLQEAIEIYLDYNSRKIDNFYGSKRGAVFLAAYPNWARKILSDTVADDDRHPHAGEIGSTSSTHDANWAQIS